MERTEKSPLFEVVNWKLGWCSYETIKCIILPVVLFLLREAYGLVTLFKPDKFRRFNVLESFELPSWLFSF